MKKIEEMVQELVAELKAQNDQRIETVNNIIMPLVDRRYHGGWNEWGLRFEADDLYVSFHNVITKRENVFKTDAENGLTIRDVLDLEMRDAQTYEAIRLLHRKGKLDEFIEYLVAEAIPTFLEGGNPGLWWLH